MLNVINLNDNSGNFRFDPPVTNVRLKDTPLSADEIITAISQLSGEINNKRNG